MPCSSRCIGAYGHLIRCDVQYNYQKELMISNDAQQGERLFFAGFPSDHFKCRFRILAFHSLIPNLLDFLLWNIRYLKKVSCCIFVHTVRVSVLDSIDFDCMNKNSQNILSVIFLYNAGGKR